MYLTISEILIKFLKYNEIKNIYGIPGSNADFLYYFFKLNNNFIINQDEKQAVYSGIGQYKSSKKISACFASVGPGVFNMIPGVICAYYESTPILIIGGQNSKKSFGKNCFQEASGYGHTVSQINLFKNITKYSTIISEKFFYSQLKNIYYHLIEYKHGPVYIEIPKDIMNKKIKFDKNIFLKIKNEIRKNKQKEKITKQTKLKIDKLLKELNCSKKPVILIGCGAIKHINLIKKISEKYNLPIISTYKGKDLFNLKFKNYFGVCGIIGSKSTNKYLADSDFVIVIGSSLNQNTTINNKLLEHKKIYHLDIKNKNKFNINIKKTKYDYIFSNINLVLKYILESNLVFQNNKNLINLIKSNIISELKLDVPKINKKITKLNFISIFNKHIPKKSIIVTEDVLLFGKFFNFIDSTNITYTNLAPIGCSLAGGIGSKIGNPEKWVFVILGDGGFNMSLHELNTIYNNNFKKMIIIILNNSSYGVVYKYQKFKFGTDFYTCFKNPDYSKISNAYKIKSETVKNINEFTNVFNKAINLKSCMLINIILDKNEKLKINEYL